MWLLRTFYGLETVYDLRICPCVHWSPGQLSPRTDRQDGAVKSKNPNIPAGSINGENVNQTLGGGHSPVVEAFRCLASSPLSLAAWALMALRYASVPAANRSKARFAEVDAGAAVIAGCVCRTNFCSSSLDDVGPVGPNTTSGSSQRIASTDEG